VNVTAINCIAACLGGVSIIASGFANDLPILYAYGAFCGLALGEQDTPNYNCLQKSI